MIIVPSEIAKQNLLEPDNLGQKIDHDKVKAVHHGVDIDNSTKVERTDYRFTVLYVSVYSPDKGTIYLLEAWKKLNFPKENAVLKIIANNLYSTFAQDLRQTYGGDIRVYHNLPLLELSALYDTSDVLVNSSVTEAFGLTSLEAMAHSLPVIVSKGAGVSELITDGREGMLFEPRDTMTLSSLIADFKRNGKRDFGKHGIECSRSRILGKLLKRT